MLVNLQGMESVYGVLVFGCVMFLALFGTACVFHSIPSLITVHKHYHSK